MDLSTPLTSLSRLFKMYASRLERLNIHTVGDLLMYVPNRYEDYTLVSSIDLLQAGEIVTIKGKVLEAKNQYIRRLTIQKVYIQDETGMVECVWFNQPFITRQFIPGAIASISGRVDKKGNRTTIQVRDYEVLRNDSSDTFHTGRLVPVYPETKGLSSKWLRNRIRELLPQSENLIREYLPQEILKEQALMELREAITIIHFPKNKEEAEKARLRLSFDELLLTQLAALIRKNEWRKKTLTNPFEIEPYKQKVDTLIKSLPFTLTNSQQRAITDIFKDIEKNEPMNRLLEGDVGSGKTVVAAITMYVAYLNGFQSVLMAPTQILAEQHYLTVANLLKPFGLRVTLFTSGSKRKTKNPATSLRTSEEIFNIAIGTHALLSKHIAFENLGLVVIDEQQRFGVEQRALLREKGKSPHFLTMTATPIPRTVLLTAFGDLDLSFLDELPSGRKRVKTWLVPNEKREKAYEWIKQKINEKGVSNQVFIVCPFIEESESQTTIKAATVEFELLKKEVFPHHKLGLLHGKLKAKEKEQVLTDFRNEKFDILVATPVVEVGIDIPNATIILIEAAERFGLSQLHQLRGRVGRNTKESYCLLFTESTSEATARRLKYMENTYSGAQLAEYDLKLRGPGDMYGTAQHGKTIFKIATFEDPLIITRTQQCAQKLLPQLASHKLLHQKVISYNTISVSPD